MRAHGRRSAAELDPAEQCRPGRGRTAHQRAHPDRQQQHRRARDDDGRGRGRRVRGREAARGRLRDRTGRVGRTGPAQRLLPARGRRPQPPPAAGARPPRRRALHRRGLVGAPALGRGAGRLRLGPRRGRHEGHGRDDPGARAPVQGGGRRPAARPGLRVPRRRGGRRRVRLALAGRAPPGPVRGVHRGARRGRRVLGDPRRGRPGLPGHDRREVDRLDAAAGALTPRARLDGPRRERRDDPRRGRRAPGPPPLPAGAHRVGAGVLRRDHRAHRDRVPDRLGRRPRRRRRQARRRRPRRRRDHPRHREPDDALRGLQGQRHPGDRRGHRRLPRAARPPGGLRARARRDPRTRRRARVDPQPRPRSRPSSPATSSTP